VLAKTSIFWFGTAGKRYLRWRKTGGGKGQIAATSEWQGGVTATRPIDHAKQQTPGRRPHDRAAMLGVSRKQWVTTAVGLQRGPRHPCQSAGRHQAGDDQNEHLGSCFNAPARAWQIDASSRPQSVQEIRQVIQTFIQGRSMSRRARDVSWGLTMRARGGCYFWGWSCRRSE